MDEHQHEDDTPLEDGWSPAVSSTDTLSRAAVDNSVARIRYFTDHLGGRVEIDDQVALADSGGPALFANLAVVRRPVRTPAEAEALHERIVSFFPGPFLIYSPFVLPTAAWAGLQLMGYPPFMVRPPGPPPPGARVNPGGGATIEAVLDAAGVEEFERTAMEAYPIPGHEQLPPGSIIPATVAAGATRLFVARIDGRAVATAYGHVEHGVVQVEVVSTRPEARGRGLGEAVTWAATLADTSLPAVLLASDPGRPVYERMGYVAVSRWMLAGRFSSGDPHRVSAPRSRRSTG